MDSGYFFTPFIPLASTPTVVTSLLVHVPAYFSIELQPFRNKKLEHLMVISEAVEDPNSPLVVIMEFDNEKSTGVCVWCDETYKFELVDYDVIGLYK